jgi:hypothetical protein
MEARKRELQRELDAMRAERVVFPAVTATSCLHAPALPKPSRPTVLMLMCSSSTTFDFRTRSVVLISDGEVE